MKYASWLVYRLQDYNINPNILTLLYGIMGVIGGVLLSLPNKICVFIGLIIFFTKGIIDWADGHLARIQDKTSDMGKWLDSACGFAGTVSFYTGIGFYMSHHINFYVIPWLFAVIFCAKKFEVPISRAWVVDFIIFLVGLHLFFS